MDDDDGVRLWLVERSYDDRNLVSLVYATEDGSRVLRRELSAAALERATVTAGRTADGGALRPVEDAAERERYAEEAARMADRHAPGDPV